MKDFKGVITALVTPFSKEGIDEIGLKQNIRFQIENGVSGIVLLGTTGEASTLTLEEQERVIAIGLEVAKGEIPVWVGTGSYCTEQTIRKTKRAKELGADGALIVTPYYNKPTQEGLFRHFEAVAHAADIPIMVYNIPGRSSINIEAATLFRIAALPNIVALKDAAGNLMQTNDILAGVLKKFPNFKVFSGDDALTLSAMALGAVGVVSVVSNLVPQQVVALVQAALCGDYATARSIHFQLLPLFKAAFIETNPVPIKSAMNICGMAAGECRLPLYKLMPAHLEALYELLNEMKIIDNLSLTEA